MTIAKPNIQVFETTKALYNAAATFVTEAAVKAIAKKGRFCISLSGGQTPSGLYKLLAMPIYNNQLDKENVFIFWGDERCVALDDKRNNAFQAKNIWLDKVAIPPENIYRMAVNLPPAQAALDYENKLKAFFNNNTICFDLVLLGLGENGHTASIFPGSKLVEGTSAGIQSDYVTEEKMYRITMTAAMINNAEQVLFIATGKNKSDILQKVINGKHQPLAYPAQLIKPLHGMLNWFIDVEAASQLNQLK